MNKSYYFIFFLLITFLNSSQVLADTVKIYPTDDAFALLYDNDAIADWATARNYQEEIYNEPLTEGLLNDAGKLIIRSDNGVGTYRLYRVSKVFDLSQLPANVEINSVKLELYKTTINNSGDISVVVTSHERENDLFMQKMDWKIQNFGTQEFSREKLIANDYTVFNFNEDGINYVKNKAGENLTLGLLTNFDFDNVVPNANILAAGWYSIENPGTEFDPYLEVEYSMEDPNPYPLYTQIESDYPSEIETKEWADDVYGNGEASCGKTIAKCGCAITSLVMMARASGVTTAVDGKDVNPGNMNAWLIDNDGYNSAQSIKWGKALDYFGSKDGDDIITPFKLKTHNEASTTVLKAEAASDNHVIGFSDSVNGGHYFVVSDYILNNFQVRDPWYYNTKTLNDVASSTNKVKDYNNDLDKANIFSYGDAEKLAGFLEITLASPAELRLINEEGKIAGYDVAGNRTEIPTSSYDPFEYIGDPGAVESVTPHYTKRMMVLEADGSYILEVIGTGVGEYNLMISMRDANGKSHELEVSTSTSVGDVDKYTININTGLIEMVSQGDDEEDDEGDDNEVSSRDAFIALVIKATGDKKNVVQEFFVRAANRIFDSIDRDSSRLAHIRLKVFAILLKVKHVDDDELSTAVKELREQLS